MADLRLQSALAHSKAIQLPKDRIQDAIHKWENAKGGSDETNLETVRYDCMMNFDGIKVAFVITALTNNHHRTAQHVRTIINKAGGEMLTSNRNDYLFVFVGAAEVQVDKDDNDRLFECALEAGASDIELDEENGGNTALCICEATDLWKLVTALQENDFTVTQFEQRYMLKDQSVAVELNTTDAREHMEAFLDKLDENEDVSHVYHSAADPAILDDA